MRVGHLLLALLLAAPPLRAQEAHPAPPATRPVESPHDTKTPGLNEGATAEGERADIIMPHLIDSRHVEFPCFNRSFACEWELPHWRPIHIGGLTLDLSPTKHVVMMIVAAILAAALLISAAVKQRRTQAESGAPKGFAAGIEAMVLYIRNEVIVPNVGPNAYKYHPYLLSLFFFILFANLLGLVPYGSTATGNISVTATLAIITFFVIEWAGIRALGKDYVKTIIYWPHDMPFLGKILMTVIMTPVEIIGKFTKPFALAVRLFANMTAGHVMVLALISMILAFGPLIGIAPLLMAVAIMLLELFVALLQAYVFTLLASSFIGQIRAAHH